MNKFSGIILFAFSFLLIGVSHGQEPIGIATKKVRKSVLRSFKELHPDATEVKWFPYPYHYSEGSDSDPIFLPILWENSTPNFYEARFSDEKGEVRNIFDFGGSWYVTSRPLVGNLPDEIEIQLKEKGYGAWKRHNAEQIVKSGEDGKFYKVWLTNENKKRILYFNQTHKLVKILKLDNDINFTEEDHEKFKNAPEFSKPKANISEKDIPEVVKASASKKYLDAKVLEWTIHERMYDPFQSSIFDHSFYDVEIPLSYQLSFFDKNKKYKVTYNGKGEVLEEVEVLELNKLPEKIKGQLDSDKYLEWSFSAEYQRIILGKKKSLYRIYGTFKDGPVELIFDSNGQLLNPKQ